MHLLSVALEWLVTHALILVTISVVSSVVIEQAVTWRRHRAPHNEWDRRTHARQSATSITAGLAYLGAKGLIAKGVLLGAALWVYDHRVATLDWTDPIVWLGIFVTRDLAYYWIHRAEHRVRVLWASHQIHHSIETFSFTSAVRLPWMESVYKPALALWVPFLGFHPVAFAAMGAFVLGAGQLQHTELGRKRSAADRIFVTPSIHRVHHGSNPRYIDKNFGSMLVVWDRMFGTFEPETEPARYGMVGDHTEARPWTVLTGGYPALVVETRGLGITGRLGHLLRPPTATRTTATRLPATGPTSARTTSRPAVVAADDQQGQTIHSRVA